MGNLLAKGNAFLARTQRRSASSDILYRRGEAELRFPAVRGKTDAVTVDSGGGAVDATIDDWIVLASDLIFDGVKSEPLGGDTITDTTDGTLYEVQAAAGQPCFRFSDPQGLRYRIHVRRIAT